MRIAASFARRSAISLFSSSGWRLRRLVGSSVITDIYTPALSDASRNWSRSPSSTAVGIPDFDIRAQVLDAGLVEHVRADLMTPAHVGLGVFQHARRGVALVHFELIQLRLQHLHGRGAILVLAALVLAGHHDARGSVREAHGRLRLVDVLAACAARAIHVHLDVRGIQLDVDVLVHFRRDEHGSKRGVPAVTGVEWRLAHQPMHARLRAQPSVSVLTGELYRGALDTRDFARARIDHFAGETARGTPAQVHAQQHLRPVLRFGAAGARLNVHERIVGIHLAVKHALELEIAHAAFEAHGIALDVGCGSLVLLTFGELEELCGIGDGLGGAIELGKLAAQLRALAPQLLSLVGLLPDRRVFQLAIDLFETFFLRVVLKETP